MTTEEILLAAATDITSLMQPQLSQEDEEEFIKFFMQKTFAMLKKQADLFVGFGLAEKTSANYFIEDMTVIMQFVEAETKKSYSFRNGRLLMYFSEEFGTAIWEGD